MIKQDKERALPVSVIISALNEEHRIQDAIESARRNNPAEILVVEGGSVDKTYEIAMKHADKAYSVDHYGLGYKRAYGVEKATQEYILTLDADQVLADDALKVLIKELEEHDFTGMQPTLKSMVNTTYWERAMGYNMNISQDKVLQTNIIGTPGLFRASILKKNNFDKAINGSCDDTDLCYRLTKMGYRLGISTAICFQKHRSTLKSTLKKFVWYGEGDCEFAYKHPERAWSIFTHPIRNYIFKKTFKAIVNGDFRYAPYFMLTGFVRHFGFYKALFKRLRGNYTDSRIKERKTSTDF
ncbi:MAG: glycosyltransferase [Verrucomicrobia bacterium]|nr:glycosyltransferase [Verrucomicrobiota bacterium]